MINKMKNNYALLNAGDESSLFYSSENISGVQKTKKLSTLLKDNFRKFRRNNSAILKSNYKTDEKKKTQPTKLYSIKHNSLLNDLKKITPQINLKYKIELYEQKGRYSLVKKDEIIDEAKYSGKNFLKQNYKDSYCYKTCLDQRGKKKFYISNQKSICYGKFRPLSSKLRNNSAYLFEENISFNINKYTDKNNNFSKIIKKDNNNKTKLRPKSSTKPSTIISSTSRPFSAKIIDGKKNINKDKQYLYFKNKCIKLKSQIDKTFDKASNASMELNKDIYESNNYDKLNKLNEKNKKKKKNKISKYRNININKNKKKKEDEKDDLYKYLDIEKNVENKFIKSYKYFDKIGKRILKQAMEIDKKKQHFLNKNENSKYIILNSRIFIKKLQNELGVLGANILATKKKFKGESAIEPNNEVEFLHKLIKENMLNNLSSDDYLKEVMKRKNISESMSNKIKKRLLSLQQKSLSIKNKVRENNFSYL